MKTLSAQMRQMTSMMCIACGVLFSAHLMASEEGPKSPEILNLGEVKIELGPEGIAGLHSYGDGKRIVLDGTRGVASDSFLVLEGRKIRLAASQNGIILIAAGDIVLVNPDDSEAQEIQLDDDLSGEKISIPVMLGSSWQNLKSHPYLELSTWTVLSKITGKVLGVRSPAFWNLNKIIGENLSYEWNIPNNDTIFSEAIWRTSTNAKIWNARRKLDLFGTFLSDPLGGWKAYKSKESTKDYKPIIRHLRPTHVGRQGNRGILTVEFWAPGQCANKNNFLLETVPTSNPNVFDVVYLKDSAPAWMYCNGGERVHRLRYQISETEKGKQDIQQNRELMERCRIQRVGSLDMATQSLTVIQPIASTWAGSCVSELQAGQILSWATKDR